QLVITDIKMPDMDGLTLMAHAKEEQIKVEFLIISGYSDFAYAQKAIGLGAKGYLLKPVKRADLQTAVEHVLQEVKTSEALSRNMEDLSRRAEETDRRELCMFMQGSAIDEVWLRETEQKHSKLWSNYRLCLLREELWINQPSASSSHSIESIAYRVFGKNGCICLQHRPHLVIAIDAAIDTGALPAALKDAQIGVITAMTNPQQGLL